MAGPSRPSGKPGIRCAGHVLERGQKAGQECTALLLTQEGQVLCHNENHPRHILDVLGDALAMGILRQEDVLAVLDVLQAKQGLKRGETMQDADKVVSIMSILKGMSRDEIDKLLFQVSQEGNRTKILNESFSNFFDSQMQTFQDRGCPEQIVEILQNQKGAVLKKASEMAIGDGNIPFLPVIPRTFRSPYDLMAMVRNAGKVGYTGYTYLNPTISDVVDAPSEPYYIYDVEDGNSTRGKSPENAEKTFKQQKRSPLTAAEVMALTVHTDVLSKHYVWAPGSRYESAGRVPFVYLDVGDRPGLGWRCVDDSDDHWGSASCGSR